MALAVFCCWANRFLQPHRVESNQDALGKGEDGWWFEGCIEGSSRLRAFNISAMSRSLATRAAELYFMAIPERMR
jgi:hypothetical protein